MILQRLFSFLVLACLLISSTPLLQASDATYAQRTTPSKSIVQTTVKPFYNATPPVNTVTPAFISASPAPVRFFAVGDTGSGSENQKAVAAAMLVQAKSYHHTAKNKGCYPTQACVKGVLHLGDIIYPVGDAKKHGDRLVKTMYKGLGDLGVPFYFSLGNHDVITNHGQDVVDTLHIPQKTYYKVAISPVVDFFAINTNTFTKTQELWLETALKDSKTPWKIVYGHHPLYSTGSHGQDNDLKVLRGKLEPILLKYKVDAYLAGHDHNYERFATASTQAKGLPYLQIVSGGGGAYLRDKRTFPKAHCKPEDTQPIKVKTAKGYVTSQKCTEPFFPTTLFYDKTHYHYLDLALTAKSLNIKVRGTANQVLDEVMIKK